jgi:hypothetical protein
MLSAFQKVNTFGLEHFHKKKLTITYLGSPIQLFCPITLSQVLLSFPVPIVPSRLTYSDCPVLAVLY